MIKVILALYVKVLRAAVGERERERERERESGGGISWPSHK